MISFGLEEEQQIIQETVRKFAAEELRPKSCTSNLVTPIVALLKNWSPIERRAA